VSRAAVSVFPPSKPAVAVAFSVAGLVAAVEIWRKLKKAIFDPYRPAPQSIFDKQIDGHQTGDEGASDIDCDHGSWPIDHDGYHIVDSEVHDLSSRHNLLLGQFGHRDIHVAPNQRAKQQ
jgi:hypothetical protein